ncbi:MULTISPECIES: hypothetical protein [Chryseobacterium]|uniref:Uncharacterized protein n=1 Tax=Chryseobacterium scophthalmum TaxID=59733 RepID=A0A1N6FRZ9_9FLAO|nr:MULTISPECIES: hypothetical protein [Chryseobacterium]MCD0477550.1 hypothetical protein [Chryseobacterium sp. LC2016-29]SIN98106.1 hypothetical protein SAMN05421769_1556 [Chryseobacterium scophthalmum]
MKSRILKAVVALVVPIVIDFIIKKVTEKLDKNKEAKDVKSIPSPH